MPVSTVRAETTRLCDHLSQAADEGRGFYPSAQLVILGDFNAHHQEWLFPHQVTNHAGREVRKLGLTLDLSQLVNCATRVPDVSVYSPPEKSPCGPRRVC